MPGEYGDWSPPAPQSPIPPQLPSSFIFMYDILLFINMSRLLNQTVAVNAFTRLYYDQLAPEFHRVFYQTSAQCYLAGCPQPAQVLALDLPSVVPDAIRPTILKQLVQSINTVGYYTGGETSYARLWYVLSDNGYHDLAVQLATTTAYPSLGYQFKNNFGVYATTLWEIFNAYEDGLPGMNSLNHVMFSTVGQWYYERLAGIELIPGDEVHLVIHPRVSFDHTMLYSVSAEHVSRKGTISVEWKVQSPQLTGDSFNDEYLHHIRVVLPDNIPTTDIVFETILPKGKCQQLVLLEQNESVTDNIVLWNGKSSNDVAGEHGVTMISFNDQTNSIVAQLKSGSYSFVASWK